MARRSGGRGRRCRRHVNRGYSPEGRSVWVVESYKSIRTRSVTAWQTPSICGAESAGRAESAQKERAKGHPMVLPPSRYSHIVNDIRLDEFSADLRILVGSFVILEDVLTGLETIDWAKQKKSNDGALDFLLVGLIQRVQDNGKLYAVKEWDAAWVRCKPFRSVERR